MTIHGWTVTAGCPKAKLPVRRASLAHAQATYGTIRTNAKIPWGERSVLTRAEAVFPDDFPEILPIDST